MNEPRAPGCKILLAVACLLAVLASGCGAAPQAAAPAPSITLAPTDTPLPTATGTATPAPTSTPTPTPTATPTRTPAPTATPPGGSGVIYFQGFTGKDNDSRHSIVQAYNLSTRLVTSPTGQSFRPLGLSPDRQSLLVAQGDSLYVQPVAGGEPVLLTEHATLRMDSTVWCPTGYIYFLETHRDIQFIYRVRPDGSGLEIVSGEDWKPVVLFPACGTNLIFWGEGSGNPKGWDVRSIWMSDTEILEPTQLRQIPVDYPMFTPDGKRIAYEEYSRETRRTELYLIELNLNDPAGSPPVPAAGLADIPHDALQMLGWSQDGQRLLVQTAICDRRCGNYRHFILSGSGALVREISLPEEMGTVSGVIWSPDGKMLFLLAYTISGEDNRYVPKNYLYNLVTGELTSLEGDVPGNYLDRVFW